MLRRCPCSAVKPPHLLVPKEIAKSPKEVAKYATVLEACVKSAYAPKEFLGRCHDEGLEITATDTHLELYAELVRLDKENKNGIWARIIKNNFAPLFIGTVDYVAGNPPWVNWESLPVEYREGTGGALWEKYRLRERALKGARLGNVKKELSALFVYVCMDHYVKVAGSLGFVITQSVFKTGANEGFRRFACGPKMPFRVQSVSDLSLLRPFESATNRTAVIIGQKGNLTTYPVPYRMWVPFQARPYMEDSDLKTVLRDVEIRDWWASPVEPRIAESTWLTAPRKAFPILQRIIGDRSEAIMDRTYAGSCTWLNGVFWVELLKTSGHRVMIKNLGEVGRTKIESSIASVEDDFVFPLLRGRDVRAWHAKASAEILVPHLTDDFSEPVSVSDLKRKAPLTFEFLKRYEKPLRLRSWLTNNSTGARPEFCTCWGI